ncbi:MAG: hypothetical protein FJ388_15035 [Verrucomicrobia bacterium]|nr:hypothetical protein [Verrucomicrobiota bacterium]
MRWAVKDYDIEVRNESANSWTTVVSERGGRTTMTRMHALEKPVRTSKFRVVIKSVAPADGVARLLELEAWGRP